ASAGAARPGRCRDAKREGPCARGLPPCRSDPTPETSAACALFPTPADAEGSGEKGESGFAELAVVGQHVAERVSVVEVRTEIELERNRSAEPFRRKVLQEFVDGQDTLPERQVRVPPSPGVVGQMDVNEPVAQE